MTISRRKFLSDLAVVCAGGALAPSVFEKARQMGGPAYLLDHEAFAPIVFAESVGPPILTPPADGAIGFLLDDVWHFSIDPVEAVKGVAYTVFPKESLIEKFVEVWRERLGLEPFENPHPRSFSCRESPCPPKWNMSVTHNEESFDV